MLPTTPPPALLAPRGGARGLHLSFTGCRQRRIRTPRTDDFVMVAPGELVVSQIHLAFANRPSK